VSIFHERMSTPNEAVDHHPAGTADTPMVMPMSEITYGQDAVLYGALHPLVTADGATVPARAPGGHPDTVPAGRP
jgi:hypothetical protein